MAMEEGALSCLLLSRPILEQDIKASYLMDHMVSDGVLSSDEEERIRSKPTRRDQAVALLELLLAKDNQAYISFYNALVRESYGDLANLLHKSLPLVSPEAQRSFSDGGTPRVQLALREGGVPQRPVVFVQRPKLVNQLRQRLYGLNQEPGWVVVYGMAGSGKSVLAAEAVRDHALLEDCFPGGVYWLSIGQLDRPDLLARIQALCFRLEQSQDLQGPNRTPSSLEEAKERLRFLMLRRYPRSLLILDDIWDHSALKAFDINCRVLLTTRDRSLTDSVNGVRHEVEVESGLGEDKALEVLAMYVSAKPQQLPEQARHIVKLCKGFPLVVSLVGALLREFPDRWSYYLLLLQRKQFRRIRKSSSYDYDALDQAMDASFQVLPQDHQRLYRELTVLEKDVKVPAKVLSVLWDLEPEEVEDILQDFVNKSLLFRDCHNRPYLYYLHDLQLDFLAEQNRDDIEAFHAKVVRQYQKHYSQQPPTSGDRESLYWFRFLTHHMAMANLTKELTSLMFSLDWVITKAQVVGPAHLINDFVEHGAMLDRENSTVRGDFQEFLSLTGYQLEQKPFPDVVQLALAQPHGSEVHRQALLQAQNAASRGRLYFDVLNDSGVDSVSRLVVQPQLGSVYSACFSHDSSKVASCGASRMLKVFKSSSGEKLLEVLAHDEEVLCCAFSPDDRLLATCSSDRKVKVWNAEKGSLLRTFEEEHEEQINHCVFTNSPRCLLLATCSDDSFMNTKLWNLNKPSSQNTMFGHLEPVGHCSFSPDDTYLATCSRDGTMKLFGVPSANEVKTFIVKDLFPDSEDEVEQEVHVRCSTWSPDGTRVICAARNAVFVFSVETSELKLDIRSSRGTVQYCHACPTSSLLAIALSYYTVELWDLDSEKKVADLSGHLSWVHRVQFSRDGSMLLSCSDDHTVRLWETRSVHTSSAVRLKRDTSVLFDGGRTTVVAADTLNRLQVREGRTGEVMFQSEQQPSRIRCTCVNSEPLMVALGREDGTVQASVRQVLRTVSQKLQQLLVSGPRTEVALGLESGSVQVLEVPSGVSLAQLQGHTRTVLHCCFSCDGDTLITSSEDTTLRVWKWRTGECKVLQGHTEQVRCFTLLYTPDAQLLSWSHDGTLKLWDLASGTQLQHVVAHRQTILSCHVSPDGRLAATTSTDRTAKLWSCDHWQCVWVLEGHQDCVRCCRFSWDSQRLATGDDNGEIRLWNVRNGSLARICARQGKDAMDSLHGGWASDLHFSPDDTLLVSTGGYVKWWDVQKGEALQTFSPRGANLKRIHVAPDFSTFVTVDNIGLLYVLRRVE